MAAKYTKVLRSIWTNPDFVALNAAEQRLFMMLFSQPDISACGVLPLMERRWGRLAADTDADSVLASLHVLETCPQPFIVTDEQTDEVWVRSYLAVDELYKVPNGRKSIDAALSAVVSPLLRAQIERVYGTLAGTLERTPGTTRGTRDTPPQQQQPAAGTLTVTGSSSPDPSVERCDGLPPAAVAAIEIYVAHRLATENDVRSPVKYANRIRVDEARTHAHELVTLGDSDPIDIAVQLFGLTPQQARNAAGESSAVPWCSAECPTCNGDAWVDTGGGLTPCPERTTG